MVKIHVYDKDDGKQVDVQMEGPRFDMIAELTMVTIDILKKFTTAERLAFLMTVTQASRPQD